MKAQRVYIIAFKICKPFVHSPPSSQAMIGAIGALKVIVMQCTSNRAESLPLIEVILS
jgi:hypothetical protein